MVSTRVGKLRVSEVPRLSLGATELSDAERTGESESARLKEARFSRDSSFPVIELRYRFERARFGMERFAQAASVRTRVRRARANACDRAKPARPLFLMPRRVAILARLVTRLGDSRIRIRCAPCISPCEFFLASQGR